MQKGFSNENDSMTEQELEKALRTAAEADVAVIFAGLPEIFESEGYDRTSMKLPKMPGPADRRSVESTA